jgi:RNA polymerase sigma-70 factor (ECF subfamily)
MPAFAPTETLAESDVELAHRVARGDTRALEQLMRRYNRALFRTARAILRDDGLAEDAVQEAYMRAYGAIGSFRGESKLSTWLIRIVANEALARRRKDARRAEVMPISGGDAVDLETPMQEDGPQRMAERGEMRRLLEAKIDRLPDSYRAVFVLRALEELSVEETAAALGIPEPTVRSRFFRARGLLREAISREIDVAFDEAFGFAGERCDRIVAGVLARIAALT